MHVTSAYGLCGLRRLFWLLKTASACRTDYTLHCQCTQNGLAMLLHYQYMHLGEILAEKYVSRSQTPVSMRMRYWRRAQ